MIINTPSIDEARKLIEKLNRGKGKKEEIIVKAKDEEFNRKILENKDVNVLLSPELTGKDKLKQRGSGLNEVLCRIASKNKVKIGINIKDLTNATEKDKATLVSRIIQNIKLCKKAGTEIKLFGDYNKKDAFSFLLTLGASTKQAKQATE